MQEQRKNDSKHASIHEIISENKRRLQNQEITQLFSTPDLSEMDLNQLSRHPYMLSNDMFTFFVHELEKWNKKIRNKEVKPFYHAELSRNMFLLSSLKIISLKKTNQITRYLEQLTLWYSKNSYNVPQPSVLMKKYNPNEEWEIRKTFKSNTPSEINNYRRRFLCSPDEKNCNFGENFLQLQNKKYNCFFETKPYQNKPFTHLKTMGDEFQNDNRFVEPFKQVMKNKDTKLAKLQHNEIRKKRQHKQIDQIQDSWRSFQSRFGQKICKNFFQGKFSKSKQFMEVIPITQQRKVQTAAFNRRRSEQTDLINSIKKGRIRTSLGIRKNFQHEQNEAKIGQRNPFMKTESNEQAKDELVVNWIDKFVVDEDYIDIRNTINVAGPNMALISNPFQMGKIKMKKKRR